MIHVPKAAGTSLEQIIWPGARTTHKPASRYPVERWQSYFTFGVVRDPYQRFASHYSYHVISSYAGGLLRREPDLKSLSPSDYLARFIEVDDRRNQFLSQAQMLRHSEAGTWPDFVLRYERFSEDAGALLQRLNIPCKDGVPHVNRGIGNDYEAILTPEVRQRIRAAYSDEFEEFGYAP